MNGRYLLDTNAVIALLKGDAKLLGWLNQATWVGISLVVELEFRAFTGLSAADITLFEAFKSRVEVIGLYPEDTKMIQEIIRLRQAFNLKLPDAMIAACALRHQATLLTNDGIFTRVNTLTVRSF